MKLAIFLRAPEVWGAERSLLTLLKSDAARHEDIHVFIAHGSPLGAELDAIGVEWSSFDFFEHKSIAAGGLRHASPISIFRDLIGIARQGIRTRRLVSRFEAILTFGLWETPEIAVAARLSGRPVIFDFHVTFGGRLGQFAIRAIMLLVSGAIAPAAATYAQAGISRLSRKQTVVARPVSLTVVPEPADLSLWPRKLKVGIFGQVDERKNIIEVIDALSSIRHEVKLMVVGLRPTIERTEYEREVLSRIESTDSDWSIHGRSHDVAELMATCDVVLNMSRHEAFGRTVVEAACVGAHPVVLQGGGPAEIVDCMGVGTIVNSFDDLRNCLLDFSRRLAKGDMVRLRKHVSDGIRDQYSPTAIGDHYFSSIESFAGTSKQRAGR